MSSTTLEKWMKSQRLKLPTMRDAPTFYRNLEEALDMRRKTHTLLTTNANRRRVDDSIDFSSNDTLSLGSSGRLRRAFIQELERHPDISIGSGSSRIMDGNYDYLEMVEREIAEFHGAETGLMLGSGYEANLAIFAAIPRAGDAIVYDELIHASTHDGMQQAQGNIKVAFRHNDVDSFRDALLSVSQQQSLIRQGQRCVIVAVESVYSMDGDICPLEDLIEEAKEVFPQGQVQFIVDEAHSTGVLGPRGSGLVNQLGLETQVAIRLHTFGKALGSSGAIILGSETIRNALLNLARPVIYTTAPAFSVAAASRSAYDLMRSGQTLAAQTKVQSLVRYFFNTIASNRLWQQATEIGIIDVPLSRDWEERSFLTHIVPIRTRQQYSYWLVFHLDLRGICAFPVDYPTVPKGQSRVRLSFHAENTESQVEALVAATCEWIQEMMDIEKGAAGGEKIPKAARQVYSGMGKIG